MELFLRVSNVSTKQGLWYDYDGNFTGLIHNEFDFCKNSKLPMPYNQDVVGWLSATRSIEDLFIWFPYQDILELQHFGWQIHLFQATIFRFDYDHNHWLIDKDTSIILGNVNLYEYV